jgi:SAM-dependent methyltransferase
VTFDVAADAYDAFMGRYSRLLAPQFAEFGGVRSGHLVLDVGCGPGALTEELVARVGAGAVAAVDPSEPFVAAARARHPGVDVRQAAAEQLPFADQAFDVVLAQLVVHFMTDPLAGLTEMRRVARPGGVIAACVWDHAGGHGPLGLFWQAARELDPAVHDESGLAGAREGHLAELFAIVGLRDIASATLVADREHATFDEWWEPFTRGVGPAGAYVARLDPERQGTLRERCRALLPEAPFVVTARAWAARGIV